MATNMRVATCGDCIHADVCERNLIFTEFSRDNPAYCENFMNKENCVEVVRCKTCRYYNEDGEYCGMWGECRHPEHFCDEGVRENGK